MCRKKDFATLLLLFAAVACVASAARSPALTIATVSSEEAFTLDGRLINASGVTSWPVVVGDEIVTNASAANLSFQDGSLLKLAAHSHVKITGTVDQPTILLLAGNLDYRLVPNSKLKLVNALDHGQDTPNQQPDTEQAPSGASAGRPPMIPHDVMWGLMVAGVASGIGIGVAVAHSPKGPTAIPPITLAP